MIFFKEASKGFLPQTSYPWFSSLLGWKLKKHTLAAFFFIYLKMFVMFVMEWNFYKPQ